MPLTRGDGSTIDPQTLTVMASAVTGRERLRFAYRAGDGAETRRQVEPYRLVSTGWRWYLVAYDLEREDWRTFRVDRVGEPYPTGARFTPRELPTGDAAEFLSRSMARLQPELEVDVSFAAPAEFVASRLPASIGPLERTGEHGCSTAGGAEGLAGVGGAAPGTGGLRVHSAPAAAAGDVSERPRRQADPRGGLFGDRGPVTRGPDGRAAGGPEEPRRRREGCAGGAGKGMSPGARGVGAGTQLQGAADVKRPNSEVTGLGLTPQRQSPCREPFASVRAVRASRSGGSARG